MEVLDRVDDYGLDGCDGCDFEAWWMSSEVEGKFSGKVYVL